MSLDSDIQISKLSLHVGKTLVTNRAFVGHLHVLFVAFLVDTMAARHKNHGSWRCEEVLATDRTVAVCRPLDALM